MSPVFSAVLEHRLELGAVGGLRRLPFFDEDTRDLEALPLAIVETAPVLDRQGVVGYLAFAGDSCVDDGALDHFPVSSRCCPSRGFLDSLNAPIAMPASM